MVIMLEFCKKERFLGLIFLMILISFLILLRWIIIMIGIMIKVFIIKSF